MDWKWSDPQHAQQCEARSLKAGGWGWGAGDGQPHWQVWYLRQLSTPYRPGRYNPGSMYRDPSPSRTNPAPQISDLRSPGLAILRLEFPSPPTPPLSGQQLLQLQASCVKPSPFATSHLPCSVHPVRPCPPLWRPLPARGGVSSVTHQATVSLFTHVP